MHDLTKRGHKIFIFIIRPDRKKPRILFSKENGIDIIEIHPPTISFSGKKGIYRHLNYLACIPAIQKEASKIISKQSIDFIYSYMPGTGSSVPAMRISKKYKIPFVLDLADMYTMIRPKIFLEKSFRQAEKILVITDYLKNDLLKKGISESKISIIPNGVNLDLFHPQACSQEKILSIRKDFKSDKIVMFSGSLQDLSIIIESAEYVIKQIPNVKFVIIGDHRDPQKSKSSWEEKVKKKNIYENFIFLGRLPRDEIPKYLLSADVCIDSFPNEPYYAAAQPIKLLEYGACGKPIVATNVEETKRLLNDGEFGSLVNPNDAKKYAKEIIYFLNNPDEANKIALSFSNFISKHYTWNTIALNLEKFLSS
jgi:glycosyltransferase involved in cell wall biosynthesis